MSKIKISDLDNKYYNKVKMIFYSLCIYTRFMNFKNRYILRSHLYYI